MKEFNETIEKSDYIITHGGVGSIIDSLKKNKKVIAVPRLGKYNEHVNDHQVEIIESFNENNFSLSHISLDLHSDYEKYPDNITTEFEDKWSKLGPIYRLEARKRD